MTSPAKLYAKLLDNPRATMSFRDFERLLRAFGFVHDRTVGSHRHYVHPLIARSCRCSRSGLMQSGIRYGISLI